MLNRKKNNTKSPHFFCETCGTEVERNAKNCPKCGSAFESVRCPACDFVGAEALFKGGCPVCGYSSRSNSGSPDSSPPIFPDTRKPAGPLSPWIYILTAAAFTAIIAAFFLTVFR